MLYKKLKIMKNLILISLILVSSLSCYSQTEEWNKTLKINTVEEYQKFLDKYPESEYSDEAKHKIILLEPVKSEMINSMSEYENFIKNHPNNEFDTYAENWIITNEQTRLNSLKKIKTYTAGVTTMQKFFGDGWNAKDPWMGQIGIVMFKKTPQESVYVLGICENSNRSRALESEERFNLAYASSYLLDNVSYNMTVMSKEEIKYDSDGAPYLVRGKDVTDYVATLVFENDLLYSKKWADSKFEIDDNKEIENNEEATSGIDVNDSNDKYNYYKKNNDWRKMNLKGKVLSINERSYKAIKKSKKIKKGENNSEYSFEGEKHTFFNSYGNIIKKEDFKANGQLQYRSTYEFNDKGNYIMRNFYAEEFGDRKISFENRSVIISDDRGNEITFSFRPDGSISNRDSSIYDDNGNLIKKINYGPNVRLNRYYLYKYDNEGNQIEENYFDKEGILYNHSTYKYDEKGNVIWGFYEISAKDSRIIIYKYEFDEKDNWIKKEGFEDEIPTSILERKIEYYDQ